MPECLEIEEYRQLAERALGRSVARLEADALVRRGSVIDPRKALDGLSFVAARRHGKLLILDTKGPSLGIRFGMTGALMVDGKLGVDELLYGPGRYEEKWIRARIHFDDGGVMALHDPRRFARIMLDPDEDVLGPEATSLKLAELELALGPVGAGQRPVKVCLMDQSKVAGLGNLLVDEILWRAGIAPARPIGSLQHEDRRLLAKTIATVLKQLAKRGGSHMGDHMDGRRKGGACPRDGADMLHSTLGGRSTYACAVHQS